MTKILIDEATVKLVLKALNTTESDCGSRAWERETEAITSLWEALAEQPAQQEPVASVRTWHKNGDQHAELDDWGLAIALLPDGMHNLYTTPQPAQRKPLTTQEIREWWASENGLEDCVMSKLDDFEQVVRAIEAAHGITEKP